MFSLCVNMGALPRPGARDNHIVMLWALVCATAATLAAGTGSPGSARPLRTAKLVCRSRGWYNRKIHELALVDHAGAVRPATGFFAPPVCHRFYRPRKIR